MLDYALLVAVTGLSGVTIFWMIRYLYQSRLTAQSELLALKDGMIESLRRRLDESSQAVQQLDAPANAAKLAGPNDLETDANSSIRSATPARPLDSDAKELFRLVHTYLLLYQRTALAYDTLLLASRLDDTEVREAAAMLRQSVMTLVSRLNLLSAVVYRLPRKLHDGRGASELLAVGNDDDLLAVGRNVLDAANAVFAAFTKAYQEPK